MLDLLSYGVYGAWSKWQSALSQNLFKLPKGTQAENFVSNAYSKNASEQVERSKKYDDARDNIWLEYWKREDDRQKAQYCYHKSDNAI